MTRDIESRLRELAEKSAEIEKLVSEEIARLGSLSKCGECGAEVEIDFRRTCGRTMRENSFTLVFKNCESCEAKKKRKARLQKKGVAENLCHCQFQNFKPETPEQELAFRLCYDFIGHEGEATLILCGSAGVGKSHLAVSVLDSIAEETIEYVTPRIIQRELEKVYGSEFSKNTGRFEKVDNLIVDELSEFRKDVDQELKIIIRNRIENEKKTMIATNMNTEELFAFFGDRTMDRMKVYLEIVEIKKESARKRIGFASERKE